MEGKAEGEQKSEEERGKTENILGEKAQSTHLGEHGKNGLKGGKNTDLSKDQNQGAN